MVTVTLDNKPYNGHIMLEPNLSMSWKNNIHIFMIISILTIIISTYFVLLGGWLVLPFSGLELILIATSSYMFFKHYNRCEVIRFTEDTIIIEQGKYTAEEYSEFQRHWSKIHIQNKGPHDIPRVSIKSHGIEKEFGTFLGYDEKMALIQTLEEMTSSFQSQHWRK
ncbi:MAG: DUF2244 domain-containing protein [Gammaproteobacteria bacterium]|nr:DUF2244 domain-containing protein [Gammaproteobacteria bacterium]